MCVPRGCLNLAVAEKLPDHREVFAQRQSTRGEGVAQVMKPHIAEDPRVPLPGTSSRQGASAACPAHDPRSPRDCPPPAAPPPEPGTPLATAEPPGDRSCCRAIALRCAPAPRPPTEAPITSPHRHPVSINSRSRRRRMNRKHGPRPPARPVPPPDAETRPPSGSAPGRRIRYARHEAARIATARRQQSPRLRPVQHPGQRGLPCRSPQPASCEAGSEARPRASRPSDGYRHLAQRRQNVPLPIIWR